MSVASFIASQRADHGVSHTKCCRWLGVSESWFYKWRDREPTRPRAAARRARRGGARVVRRLRWHTGHLRVPAHLGGPHRGGLAGVEEHGGRVDGPPGSCGPVPETQAAFSDPSRQGRGADPGPGRRDFTATEINQRWCGDLTEIPSDEGKLYLATVEDLASRRLPGFAMSDHHDAALAKAALCMAAAVRGGDVTGVVFHSDKGGEYTGDLFAQACDALGVIQSMGRVGSALDNAAAESFNSTLEHEVLSRHRFATKADARRAVARFIDAYNHRRRHSSCEMLPPVAYEALLAERAADHEQDRAA